jgi:hypothetical protein
VENVGSLEDLKLLFRPASMKDVERQVNSELQSHQMYSTNSIGFAKTMFENTI